MLKITISEGTASHRAKQEDDSRAIEFDDQMFSEVENQWTSVLGKKHDSKFMVQNILTQEE